MTMPAMDRKFYFQDWKLGAIFSFVGMNMGAILITATIPLAIITMGETNVEEIAENCASFRPLSHWLIGMGGITFLACTLALIATFAHKRLYHIFVTVFLIINTGLALALLIWGLIPTDARKEYIGEVWKEADMRTKNLIQNHYSCCGFDSPDEYRSKDSSCYANETLRIYWPDGCYDKMTSQSLPTPTVNTTDGDTLTFEDKSTLHVFLFAFVLPFVVLVFIDFIMFVIFMAGILKRQERDNDSKENSIKDAQVYQNEMALESEQENQQNGVDKSPDTAIITMSKVVDNASSIGDVTKDREVTKKKWYAKIPDAISSTLENGFYWLGVQVGSNPKMVILLSLILTGTLFIGLLQRREQPTGSSGFLPEDAQIIKEYVAYRQTFPVVDRDQTILIVAEDNLLTEDKFRAMAKIDAKIRSLNGTKGRTFSQICTKSAGQCKERSLFEFWSFNETALAMVTTDEIKEKINGDLVSPVFRDEVDITTMIGGITRDGKGDIIGAKAHRMYYVVSRKDDDWEKAFIEVGNAEYEGFSVYVESRGSRSLEAGTGYRKDLPLLFAGFALIFVYIILMTGKFSLLEHRTYIAMMGIVTAGLSMGAGIGLSASFGFEWSVIHLVAPFLIIGIGVDDMFILIQSWNTIDDDPHLRKLPLAKKSGHALKSAGVSITVTSVTDLVAFAVGSSSELGSFASFSIYVAVCIILLFFLQCTLFLACTVLDQRRREENYDACLACCYKHDENYKQSECSQREFFATFFEDVIGKVVQMFPVQIAVILATLGLTALMGWGFTLLKVSFDPDWYLPQESYLIPFGKEYDKYFAPGQDAAIFIIDADFYEERDKLHILYEKLKKNTNIDPTTLTSWFENYVYWMSTEKNVTDIYKDDAYVNSQQFFGSVMEYLTGKGRVYASEVAVRFGKIVGSRFRVQHIAVEENVQNVDIMDSLHEVCDSVGFSDYSFPFHRSYFQFSIMKIIRSEVYRNLGITLLCVFVMVLPMIASLQMSFWVVICVVFTIIDVAGSMYFTGLTIETSTIITLLLSVGLAVDYAAHVAHKFLTLRGTKRMRVRVTLGQIGPAVFNGGFSTFLALVLLSGSNTYSYKVFFTVFVCVVGYGLWNGLIFLPCILGLVGPPPHITAVEAKLSERHLQRKNKVKNDDNIEDVQENMAVTRT
uniref:patched domain-containing protein 3-like n=1 Tax=Styela clava TaxID=7725 RepID=UPI00193A37CE|nr:patched domain-containing protein 3-like [Styela clava]